MGQLPAEAYGRSEEEIKEHEILHETTKLKMKEEQDLIMTVRLKMKNAGFKKMDEITGVATVCHLIVRNRQPRH